MNEKYCGTKVYPHTKIEQTSAAWEEVFRTLQPKFSEMEEKERKKFGKFFIATI